MKYIVIWCLVVFSSAPVQYRDSLGNYLYTYEKMIVTYDCNHKKIFNTKDSALAFDFMMEEMGVYEVYMDSFNYIINTEHDKP